MPRTTHSQQNGSTTLGIIVGILLGLAVALGVSLYLATSGAPVQTKAANSAARIEPPADPSKAPDPNQSLYTKVPKTEETKSSEKPTSEAKPESKQDTKTDAKAEAKPAETAKPPAASKPDQDAIGKIAAVATPASAATAAKPNTDVAVAMPKAATASDGGERYFVQAGAFANVTDAEAVKARLALLGVSMALSPRERDGQVLQRVRTAPLAAVDAEKLRNTLKANGIETSLVKVQ